MDAAIPGRSKEMYKICICDDESIFLDKINEFVKVFFSGKSDIHVLTFSDSAKFADNIPQAELYLLDVKMPEISGMELAQKIRDLDQKCSIIFISSLYEPVFDSFRYTPLRYIRREYLEEELPAALSAFGEIQQRSCRTIPVMQNGLEISISLSSLRYCESDAHYVVFHCLQKEYRIRGKLSDYSAELLPYGFARPNKSFIVNLFYISVLTNQNILLDNGTLISVSRAYKETFKTSFLRYQRNFHNDDIV